MAKTKKPMEIAPQSLIDAIAAEDLDGIRAVVSSLPDVGKPEVFTAAMAIAIARGSYEGLQCLLEEGADANLPDPRGEYPLHLAAARATVATVDLLLKFGADPNVQNFSGLTPLHEASSGGGITVVKKLLRAGASPDVTARTGDRPLMFAAERGNLPVVQALITAGADVCAADRTGGRGRPGNSVLHHAVRSGDASCVSCVLEAGSDPLAKGKFGKLPVALAAEEGHPAVVELLEQYAGEGGRASTAERTTARTLATSRQKARDGSSGGNLRTQRALSGAPLHDAAVLGDIEQVESLLRDGCNPEDRDRYGFLATHKAAQFGHGPILETLLKAGVDINAATNTRSGARPLHYAAGYGQTETVKLLLELGSDPDETDSAGERPVDWALSPRTLAKNRKANAESAKILQAAK